MPPPRNPAGRPCLSTRGRTVSLTVRLRPEDLELVRELRAKHKLTAGGVVRLLLARAPPGSGCPPGEPARASPPTTDLTDLQTYFHPP